MMSVVGVELGSVRFLEVKKARTGRTVVMVMIIIINILIQETHGKF
jgi:hypothetical protein